MTDDQQKARAQQNENAAARWRRESLETYEANIHSYIHFLEERIAKLNGELACVRGELANALADLEALRKQQDHEFICRDA